jgi:hypothetical protein
VRVAEGELPLSDYFNWVPTGYYYYYYLLSSVAELPATAYAMASGLDIHAASMA